MKLQYPIYIEQGDDDTAWGVVVPDLKGCFSAADDERNILDNAREAILLHLSELSEFPEPSSLKALDVPDGMAVGLVDVDLDGFEGPSKRINITVPAALLSRIDSAAREQGKSRSSYMTEAALREG